MTFTSASQQDEHYTVQLGDNGNLVLPNSVRQHLNLQTGDRFILTVELDGSLRLVSERTQIRNLQGIFKDVAPGVSLADELVAERRTEAGKNQ